jgi:hypothetical protein
MLRHSKLAASTACTKRNVLLSAGCVSVSEGCVHVSKEVSFYPHPIYKLKCWRNHWYYVWCHEFRWTHTLDQFIVEWQFFQKIAHQIKKQRNKIMKIKRIIKTRWKFLNFFFNDWSKLSFSQFVERINRTIFQKRRYKTNQQNCRTSCDAFNVKSKIHHRYHCQWYHSRFEFEFVRSFEWNNASSREIFRETKSICRNEQLDVFSNFNRFVIIIIRR